MQRQKEVINAQVSQSLRILQYEYSTTCRRYTILQKLVKLNAEDDRRRIVPRPSLLYPTNKFSRYLCSQRFIECSVEYRERSTCNGGAPFLELVLVDVVHPVDWRHDHRQIGHRVPKFRNVRRHLKIVGVHKSGESFLADR